MTPRRDLEGFDVPALRDEVLDMALRQDRYRREALSIGVPADCKKTSRLVQLAERDAETLVDLERLLTALARPVPTQSRRPGLLARAFAALTSSRNGGAS